MSIPTPPVPSSIGSRPELIGDRSHPRRSSRLSSLVELALEDGDSFERGIQLAVQAVLVSPHFLFRVELDSPAARVGARPLTGRGGPSRSATIELASRLSYFLWSTMPDEELFRPRRRGEAPIDPRCSPARSGRMLVDPRVPGPRGKLRRTVAPDPEPEGRSARIATGSPASTSRSARRCSARPSSSSAEIIREDRSILDLLDADFTYLNERLARHYGIGA